MFILVERESSRNHCNGARKTFGRRTGSGGPSAPRERQCACPAVDDVFSANLTYPGVIQEQYERIRHTLTLIQQKKYRSAYSVEAGKVSNAELAQFDIKSQAVHHPTKSSGRRSPVCSRSIFTGRQLRSKGGRLFLMLNYRTIYNYVTRRWYGTARHALMHSGSVGTRPKVTHTKAYVGPTCAQPAALIVTSSTDFVT